MKQTDLIRRHLKDGKSITPAQAIAVYGIFRLASVIFDLRNEGMEIDMVLKWDEMGKQYGLYRERQPIVVGSTVQLKPGHGWGLPNWVRRQREAKVLERGEGMGSVLVRFVRGRNVKEVWMLDKELVHAGA